MTFLSVLTNTFQSAFALLVWTRKSVLQGNPGDCPAKYIIFGHSVSVTNNVLRGFSLFGYASAILGGFLSPLFSYVYSKFVQIIGKYQTRGYVWDIKSDSVTSPGDDSDSDSDDEDLDLSFFRTLVFAFSGLGSWIYLVITTETILLRNDVAMQSNTWSFGQTVATVLVLLPIIDFLSVVKSFYQLFFFPALIFIVYSHLYQIFSNGYSQWLKCPLLLVDHPYPHPARHQVRPKNPQSVESPQRGQRPALIALNNFSIIIRSVAEINICIRAPEYFYVKKSVCVLLLVVLVSP